MLLNRLFCGCSKQILSNFTAGRVLQRETWKQTKYVVCGVSFQHKMAYSFNNPQVYHQKEGYWKTYDNIPREFELVYKCERRPYVTMVSTITIVSGVILLVFASAKYLFDRDTPFEPVMLTDDQVFAASMGEVWVCAGLFGLLGLASMIATNRFIFRIYRNNNDFVAIYASFLPGLKRMTTFKAGEVTQVIPKVGLTPWAYTLFRVKGKKSIMYEDLVRTKVDLKAMMGGKDTVVYEDEF